MTTPTRNGTASPAQIARVCELAEVTGITVGWLARWYVYWFGRPLDQMDATTARELIRYLPRWPVRLQKDMREASHGTEETRHPGRPCSQDVGGHGRRSMA